MPYMQETVSLTEAQAERFREHFAERVQRNGECAEWISSSPKYPQVHIAGRTMRAHRVAYMAFVGPIPGGLVLDHLCMNTMCVNPDHLEPVTQSENAKRAVAALQGTGVGAWDFKESCLRGHRMEGDNVHISRSGRRLCRACGRERNRRLRAEDPERMNAYGRAAHARKKLRAVA